MERRRHRGHRWALVVLTISAAACDHPPQYVTEDGWIGVDLDGAHIPLPMPDGEPPPIVAGSRVCPTIDGVFAEPHDESMYNDGEGELDACFRIDALGPITWDGECATLDEPGTLRLDLQPQPCDEPEAIHADTLEVEIADPTTLVAGFVPERDLWMELLTTPVERDRFPEGWRPAPGERLQVAAGQELGVSVELLDSSGRWVGYSDCAPQGFPPPTNPDREPHCGGLFIPDSSETLTPVLELPRGPYRPGEVVHTDVTEARSIEIVAGRVSDMENFLDVDADVDVETFILRAWVRDAEGRPIYAAPAEWSILEGFVELRPDLVHPGGSSHDYATVSDSCLPDPGRPEPRETVVQVRLGDLEDTLRLTWTAEPGPRPELTAERRVACQGPDELVRQGCACRASAPTRWSQTPWLLLAALWWWRRPRRSSPPRSRR